MKILYGIQGTGNGHITRSLAVTDALSHCDDVSVDVIVSGRPSEPLPFHANTVSWRRGLTFVTDAGNLSYRSTAFCNNPLTLVSEVRGLSLENYDLIISDFEPVTSWAARLRGKKVIGIGNQYAFGHQIPTGHGNPVGKLVLKHFAPVTLGVGLHWHHFQQPILPPIVDVDTQRRHKIVENKVVVYLPFEDQFEVVSILQKCRDFDFYIYSAEHEDRDIGNIHLRKTSRISFKDDLYDSRAVICNAGFELISECLSLGISIFTKPVGGQIEQISNATALEVLAYATVSDRLLLPSIKTWLQCLPAVRVSYPLVQSHVASWLAGGAVTSVEELAESLWREVHVCRS